MYEMAIFENILGTDDQIYAVVLTDLLICLLKQRRCVGGSGHTTPLLAVRNFP